MKNLALVLLLSLAGCTSTYYANVALTPEAIESIEDGKVVKVEVDGHSGDGKAYLELNLYSTDIEEEQ